MKSILISIILAIFVFVVLSILPKVYFNLSLCLFGLYCAVRFRSLGRSGMESREKFTNLLSSPKNRIHFSETDIQIAQILTLLVGILVFFVGLAKLFS